MKILGIWQTFDSFFNYFFTFGGISNIYCVMTAQPVFMKLWITQAFSTVLLDATVI